MATGWPMKTTYANGDVYSASDVNDITGTINLLQTSTLSGAAGKNAVINGGMDIWQRGTSISVSASTAPYTVDRWTLAAQANQASTVSRQATGDTTNLPTIQYCARVQRNSGQTGTGGMQFVQTFETVNSIRYAGQTVTLSFYARRGSNYSPTSNLLNVYGIAGTGTDQSRASVGFTGETYWVNNQNATLTTTWQRFTFSGTVSATATQLAVYFAMTPTGTAGTNDYFEITGVQLELGSAATTFARSNGGGIQGELAACQRYYYRTTPSSPYARFAVGSVTSTTFAQAVLKFPITMRVAPTALEQTGTASNYALLSNLGVVVACSVVPAFDTSTIDSINISFTTASGLTTGQATQALSNNNTTAYLGWSAEL